MCVYIKKHNPYGLSITPLMFAVSFFGLALNVSVRNVFKKIMPYCIAFMALLLILRGLNLGIPYISPYFYKTVTPVVSCH